MYVGAWPMSFTNRQGQTSVVRDDHEHLLVFRAHRQHRLPAIGELAQKQSRQVGRAAS
jgi:hypothetical protein